MAYQTGEPDSILVEVVRSLTEADLPTLQNPSPTSTAPVPIQKLRSSHHQLAQLLAQGRPDPEVALISGYSYGRIATLKADPSFRELLAGYQAIRNQIFVDTLERMKILGLSTLDELQERLETAPEKWTNRELMEMADLMLVKPRTASSGAVGGTGTGSAVGVAIQVQFVKSDTPSLQIEGTAEPNPKEGAR